MQNTEVGMTKEQYFEMCEALGTQPVESEVPVELDDMPLEVQSAFEVYRVLRDDWDFVGGNYLGKSLIGIADIFELLDVPVSDRKTLLLIIRIIDNIRQAEVSKKLKQQT